MLVGASCTAELIQDDPGGLAAALGLPIPVVAARAAGLPAQGELGRGRDLLSAGARARRPSALPAPRHDARTPAAGRAATCSARPRSASATATTSREVARAAGRARRRRQRRRAARRHAGRPRAPAARPTSTSCSIRRSRAPAAQLAASARFGQPIATTVPIGVGATRDFIARGRRAGRRRPARRRWTTPRSRSPWYSRSVDSTYLTGKRVFIFGDATHAVAAARVAREELGFTVVGLGTYSREFAREVRDAAEALRRRGADHRRLPRGRGARSPSCSPSWCSARRWSATSPSASASPAR